MDPRLTKIEEFGVSDENLSGNTSDPLGSCAEAWARYQASYNIFQDIFDWSSRMLSQGQNEQANIYKQTQIHANEYENWHRAAFSEKSTNPESAILGFKIKNDSAQDYSNQVSAKFYEDQSPNSTISSPYLDQYDATYQLEALDEKWQFYLTILYTLTAITSFLLNVVTVIVLSRGQHSELKKYLINLSVGDLLMSCFSIRKFSDSKPFNEND